MIRTILCLSDTHNRHRSLRNLPQADVLVHCGDFTEYGTEAEALDFLNWFCDQPYRYKLFTVGNHDVCLYGGGVEGLDGNCYFLSGNGVTLDGVHFHGLPFFIEGLESHSVQAAIPPAQHTAPLSSSQERPSGPSLSPVLPIQSFRHHHFTFSHISIY